jgi:hypothetical protein
MGTCQFWYRQQNIGGYVSIADATAFKVRSLITKGAARMVTKHRGERIGLESHS